MLICLLLILVGGIIGFISFLTIGFDFMKLSGTRAEEMSYTEVGEITEINLNLNTTDLTIGFGGDKIEAKYTEIHTTIGNKLAKTFEPKESGAALEIKEVKLFEPWYVLFDFANEKLELTLPEGRAYKINIESNSADVRIIGTEANIRSLTVLTDTGDITTEGLNLNVTEKVDIETDTGDVELGSIVAASLSIKTNTGDVELGSIAVASLSIKTNTGDVELCDLTVSDGIDMETNSGDIDGKGKITAKKINIKLDTGDLYMLDSLIDAEEINVVSDTGDVELNLVGKQRDYTVLILSDTGNSNIRPSAGGSRVIDIETDTGDIKIYFTE